MLRINLKIGTKRIGWQFGFDHDARFQSAFILPWALPDYQFLAEDAPVDFLVLVYPLGMPESSWLPPEFIDFTGTKFILSAESYHRFLLLDRCYTIVSGPKPEDHANCRYGPVTCFWCPPLATSAKARCCSVIESGKHPWRIQMLRDFMQQVMPVDLFGKGTGAPLPGYHNTDAKTVFGNAKYLGLKDHAFYLSIENATLDDYWTEKLGDAILCESVPIYHGCTNILDYFIPESFIPWADAPRIAWSNWCAEYDSRHKYVLMQKDLLRAKFNIWSYINLLTDDLSQLDKKRPITR